MAKKNATKSAQQPLNANLVNKNGAAASSNALNSINFSSIRCHVCARVRGIQFYSNRQILKHQNTIHNAYIPSGRSLKDHATCKDCTASQVETLHCFICNADKPLNKFLLTQRRVAKPRCKACVQYCLDTERIGETPNLDHYRDDSSDESDVDDDENVDVDVNDDDDDVDKPVYAAADVDEAEDDSDGDVDAPPAPKVTANVSKQMASMSIQSTSSGSSGTSTPRSWGGWGSNPSSRATPIQGNILDNDVNGSNDGAWETVRVAGKTNSAYRTPSYASRVASGIASPASNSINSSTESRASTSGYASPSTPATSVSYSSTGGGKWGKPVKLKPGEVVDDVWKSDNARRNNWNPWGGQPKMVQPKKTKRMDPSDDSADDDED